MLTYVIFESVFENQNTKYNYQYTDTWYLSIPIIDKYNGQVSDLNGPL